MALISCIECEHVVSEHADACPHCGCPVSYCTNPPGTLRRDLPGVQTVQQTAKPIKFFAMLAFLTMFAGCAGIFLRGPNPSPADGSGTVFGMMILGGSTAFIGAKILGWWNHG